MPQTTKVGSVEAELAQLGELSLADIRSRFFELTSTPLPKHVRTGLARLILAHAIQTDGLGGLDRTTAKELDRQVALIVPQGAPAPKGAAKRLRAGSRLVRQWRGRVYEVTVTATGFDCGGRSYRSLTETARDITGTNWNGWTFFGVKRSTLKATADANG